MRRQSAIPLLTVLFFTLSDTTLMMASDRHFEVLDLGNGEELHFAYHLPTNFNPQNSYPVLIGPNGGKPGSDAGFFWKVNMPEKLDWILVEAPIYEQSEKAFRKLLDHLQQKFKVEGGKFHLVGWSANSGPVFNLAHKTADRIASVTGIPGHPTTGDADKLKAFKKTKLHFIVGENDGYWRREAERIHKLAKSLGIDSTLDIIANGKHVLRELIGAPFLKKMERMRLKRE